MSVTSVANQYIYLASEILNTKTLPSLTLNSILIQALAHISAKSTKCYTIQNLVLRAVCVTRFRNIASPFNPI